jgi:hypothetical protein
MLSPEHLKYLIIAPPKWGKTTFFSGVPNACLLAFEAGYASAECPIVVVTHWDRPYKEKKEGWGEDEHGVVYTSAMELMDELERANPYDFLILDTVDMAAKLCTDYHCDLARVEHPSDGGDYGRGWDLLQTGPFRKFYNRLVKLGVGVAAITHAKERTDKDKFSKDRFRRETSLPTGIQQFIHSQSDVIMHGFFSRRRKGQHDRDRYISFDGSNEVMAGTRIRQVHIPNKYIVAPPMHDDLSFPWKQWLKFFTDSPKAGLTAEEQFAKLSVGRDDENIEEASRETETNTTQKDKSDAIQEKDSNTTSRDRQQVAHSAKVQGKAFASRR